MTMKSCSLKAVWWWWQSNFILVNYMGENASSRANRPPTLGIRPKQILFSIFLRRNHSQKSILHISKCAKSHLQQCRILPIFPGVTPRSQLQGQGRGLGRRRKGGKGEVDGKDMVQRKGRENLDRLPTSFGLHCIEYWDSLELTTDHHSTCPVYSVSSAELSSGKRTCSRTHSITN